MTDCETEMSPRPQGINEYTSTDPELDLTPEQRARRIIPLLAKSKTTVDTPTTDRSTGACAASSATVAPSATDVRKLSAFDRSGDNTWRTSAFTRMAGDREAFLAALQHITSDNTHGLQVALSDVPNLSEIFDYLINVQKLYPGSLGEYKAAPNSKVLDNIPDPLKIRELSATNKELTPKDKVILIGSYYLVGRNGAASLAILVTQRKRDTLNKCLIKLELP